MQNETVRFTCTFEGFHKPVIIWQRETFGLPQSTRTNELVLELRNNITGNYTVTIKIYLFMLILRKLYFQVESIYANSSHFIDVIYSEYAQLEILGKCSILMFLYIDTNYHFDKKLEKVGCKI